MRPADGKNMICNVFNHISQNRQNAFLLGFSLVGVVGSCPGWRLDMGTRDPSALRKRLELGEEQSQAFIWDLLLKLIMFISFRMLVLEYIVECWNLDSPVRECLMGFKFSTVEVVGKLNQTEFNGGGVELQKVSVADQFRGHRRVSPPLSPHGPVVNLGLL